MIHGGVAGWVEAVGEGGAVADADSVAAGESDEVVGVEVEFGEGVEEDADV